MTFVIFCFLGYIDSVSNRTIKQIFLFYKFLMFDHGDVCLTARYRRYANLTMFIAFSLRRGLGSSPMLGTLNAVIAETATYSYNKEGVRLDGTMLRCSLRSVVALTGWLLTLDGFDDEAAV